MKSVRPFVLGLIVVMFTMSIVSRLTTPKSDTERSVKYSFKPALPIPVKFSIDDKCQLSATVSDSHVTPIGVFEISVTETLKPHKGKMLIIVRRSDEERDQVYEFELGTEVKFEDQQILISMEFQSPERLILRIKGCTVPPSQNPTPPTPIPAPENPAPDKIVPQYPDHPVDMATFAHTFGFHPGLNLARVIHPVTNTEYYLNFTLPNGAPTVRHSRHQVKLVYPSTTVTIDFNRKGGVNISYD